MFKRTCIIFLYFLILVTLVYGKDNINNLIRTRPAGKIELQISDTENQEIDIPEMPYVKDGLISIVAGETLYIEFDIINGQLVNPRYVERVNNKDKTIALQLTQDSKKTMLKIINPFSETLVYKCLLQNYNERKFKETNVLPVLPNMAGYEGWPNTVCQLLLKDVAFQKK